MGSEVTDEPKCALHPIGRQTNETNGVSMRHPKRKAAKRALIHTGADKRYVRRNKRGEFKESDDVGRSLGQDRKQTARTVTKSGHGDKGDRRKVNR